MVICFRLALKLNETKSIWINFGNFPLIVSPTRGPQITGGQPRYQIGDTVKVNCTSAPSKPICHLSWLINGLPVNRSFLKHYDSLMVGREGLEIARLGLEFRVRSHHFKHGDMKLKVSCWLLYFRVGWMVFRWCFASLYALVSRYHEVFLISWWIRNTYEKSYPLYIFEG